MGKLGARFCARMGMLRGAPGGPEGPRGTPNLIHCLKAELGTATGPPRPSEWLKPKDKGRGGSLGRWLLLGGFHCQSSSVSFRDLPEQVCGRPEWISNRFEARSSRTIISSSCFVMRGCEISLGSGIPPLRSAHTRSKGREKCEK